MSDNNINPASKSAQPVPECPFLCPYCGQEGSEIMVTAMGALVVLWHKGCRAILNCQLVAMPQQAQPRIVTPQVRLT